MKFFMISHKNFVMMKWKATGPIKKDTSLLETIHMGICGPFDVNTLSLFICDYSRYGYVYLQHVKF